MRKPRAFMYFSTRLRRTLRSALLRYFPRGIRREAVVDDDPEAFGDAQVA